MSKDKLVCIGDFSIDINIGYCSEFPIKGEIYTFESVKNPGFILVKELTKTVLGERPRWAASEFRPVDYSFGEEICESIREPEPVVGEYVLKTMRKHNTIMWWGFNVPGPHNFIYYVLDLVIKNI